MKTKTVKAKKTVAKKSLNVSTAAKTKLAFSGLRSKIVKVGNSKGLLFSKSLLEQCNIKDEVTLVVTPDGILISPIKKKSREGWAEAFEQAGPVNDTSLKKLREIENSFDKDEWEW